MYAKHKLEQWFYEDETEVSTPVVNFDQFIVNAAPPAHETLGILIKLRSGGVYVIEEDFDG